MSREPYRRVDLRQLPDHAEPGDAHRQPQAPRPPGVRWAIVPLSVALCIIQAVINISATHNNNLYTTATLISIIGFGFLMLLVLAVNPLIRLCRGGLFIRPFTRAELICVMAALLVTSGISTFGLVDALLPMIPAPWDPQWNTQQRGWDTELLPHMRQELYITDPEAIREGLAIQQPGQSAGWAVRLDYYRRVIAGVPWGRWARPLGYWLIFVIGCYAIFYSLTYVVLPYWSRREQLIFPIARLHEALLPERSGPLLPSLFGSSAFWAGFAASFCILLYNAAVMSGRLPLDKLRLGMSGGTFNTMVKGTAFDGLAGGFEFLIVFTAVGIAYLLPLEISFSVWFYFIVGRLTIFVLVLMGHGGNFADFPSDWTWTQNPIAAQGMGAILLFSAIAVYRCARDLAVQCAQRAWRDRLHILLPFLVLLASVVVVVGWVCWNHVPPGWAVVFVLFLVLITTGLMRIVAQGGIYWLQTNAGFFHFYKMLGLGRFFAPLLVAPLVPIYAILFFDIKTFMAPSLLNAAKMQQDAPCSGGGGRLRFHLSLVTSVAASIVVSIFYSLTLAYARGAQQMDQWFYTIAPQRYLDRARQATTLAAAPDVALLAWFASGAAWFALSIWVRRTVFWFPHPIGFIMYINPLMVKLWFSFFLGWVCKKIVVRYGAKPTFDAVGPVVLGLIAGELIAIFIASGLTMMPWNLELRGIDLNRYAP